MVRWGNGVMVRWGNGGWVGWLGGVIEWMTCLNSAYIRHIIMCQKNRWGNG